MKVKEESEKAGLKLSIQRMKIMASSPITSWRIHRETMETVKDFIFWAPKVPGVGDGQGSLACCSSWGHKESDVTERLN